MWIPAIDLSQGQSVRLYQGDFEQKTIINSNPLAQAQQIEAAGMQWLHLVDLDGAKAGNPQNLSVIQAILKNTNLKVELGGGIRSLDQIETYLKLGITRVIIGSAAINNPSIVKQAVDQFGAEKIVVGVDGRNKMVATEGWLETSSTSMADVIAKMIGFGADTFIVTDIDKDGTMQGPNTELLVELQSQFRQANIIASGGIRDIDDLQNLKDAGIDSAVIGKALSNGGITLEQLKAVD